MYGRQALKKTKIGRTPGIDGIPAELYKADSNVAVKELTRLRRRYPTNGRMA